METTVVYDTYWRFAAKRQALYMRRLNDPVGPWTDDPILSAHRFTNAYRASDRVSQFLIRDVQYREDRAQTPRELFFRTLLFKIFNRIETWRALESRLAALARTLSTYTLLQESPLPWSPKFVGCGYVYSPHVIYGLAYFAAQETTFAGWTDADLFFKDGPRRFYAPICRGPGEVEEDETYRPSTVESLIVPQLLCTSFEAGKTYLHVRRLMFEPWKAVRADFIRRDQIFIDAVACTDRSDARAHILEVAADRLVRALKILPLDERRDALAKSMGTAGPLSMPLFAAVSQSFPEWASRP